MSKPLSAAKIVVLCNPMLDVSYTFPSKTTVTTVTKNMQKGEDDTEEEAICRIAQNALQAVVKDERRKSSCLTESKEREKNCEERRSCCPKDFLFQHFGLKVGEVLVESKEEKSNKQTSLFISWLQQLTLERQTMVTPGGSGLNTARIAAWILDDADEYVAVDESVQGDGHPLPLPSKTAIESSSIVASTNDDALVSFVGCIGVDQQGMELIQLCTTSPLRQLQLLLQIVGADDGEKKKNKKLVAEGSSEEEVCSECCTSFCGVCIIDAERTLCCRVGAAAGLNLPSTYDGEKEKENGRKEEREKVVQSTLLPSDYCSCPSEEHHKKRKNSFLFRCFQHPSPPTKSITSSHSDYFQTYDKGNAMDSVTLLQQLFSLHSEATREEGETDVWDRKNTEQKNVHKDLHHSSCIFSTILYCTGFSFVISPKNALALFCEAGRLIPREDQNEGQLSNSPLTFSYPAPSCSSTLTVLALSAPYVISAFQSTFEVLLPATDLLIGNREEAIAAYQCWKKKEEGGKGNDKNNDIKKDEEEEKRRMALLPKSEKGENNNLLLEKAAEFLASTSFSCHSNHDRRGAGDEKNPKEEEGGNQKEKEVKGGRIVVITQGADPTLLIYPSYHKVKSSSVTHQYQEETKVDVDDDIGNSGGRGHWKLRKHYVPIWGKGMEEEGGGGCPLTKDPIVDTNGAGDAFTGGLLAALAKHPQQNMSSSSGPCFSIVSLEAMLSAIAMGHCCAAEIVRQVGCTIPKTKRHPRFS